MGYSEDAVAIGYRVRRGARIEGDPFTLWDTLVTSARQAVAGVDLTMVVESPVGRRSIADGLAFPAVDLFVHAWELARILGRDVVIPAEVIDRVRP